MFLIDDFSGDCAFGLCSLLTNHRLDLEGLLISYGTAPVDTALRNAGDYLTLLKDSKARLFSGASSPLVTPEFMNPVPRFYGLDGKLGVDFRTLAGANNMFQVEGSAACFFELVGQRSRTDPVVLCVLGPWTDVAAQLRRERENELAAMLDRVIAVVTVAGAFALDPSGKSIGNEGSEGQAEYNAYLDPQALAEGVAFFNRAKIPVYDISWAFVGRWRVWRGLLDALKPENPKDGLAWSALLLAHGFYIFHGGNVVPAGAGTGERAWFTADAHALVFAEALTQEILGGRPPPRAELRSSWSGAHFKLTPTEFVVVCDDQYPSQYGRTVRIADRKALPPSVSVVSGSLQVYEASLAEKEEDVLACVIEAMGITIDYQKWTEVLAKYQPSPH